MSRVLLLPVLLGLVACAPDAGQRGAPVDHELVRLRGEILDGTGMIVAATAREDGALWMASVAADGSFVLEAGAGELALALLDSNQSPVALYQGDAGSWFSLESETELGTLAWSDETHVLSGGASARRGLPDLSDFVGIDTSKDDPDAPLPGLDVAGDVDEDGVPDVFDNDRNNNGRYDAVEVASRCSLQWEEKGDGSVPSEALQAVGELHCAVFDNLKLVGTELLRGDGDALPRTDDHKITYQISAPPALVPYIDSVEMASIPAYANGSVAEESHGWTYAGYPAVGSAWAASGHELVYAVDPLGEEMWTMWVRPTTDPAASVYQFRIRLSDGGSVLATTRLAFVFHTGALVTTYTDGTGDIGLSYPLTEGEPATSSEPLVFDSSGIYSLTARRPLDRAGGSEICGMTVQTEIFYEDASGGQIADVPLRTADTVDTDPCDPAYALQTTLTTADLPKTVDGVDVEAYRIGFMVSGAQSDNTASTVWARW